MLNSDSIGKLSFDRVEAARDTQAVLRAAFCLWYGNRGLTRGNWTIPVGIVTSCHVM